MINAKRLFIKVDGEKWESSLLLRLIFLISGTAMTGLCAATGRIVKEMVIGILLSFGVLCWLIFKRHLIEILFEKINKPGLALCAVFSTFASYEYGTFLLRRLELKLAVAAMSVCSILAICAALYAFYRKLSVAAKDWFDCADKVEKRYLLITGIVLPMAIIAIFNITNVFYGENHIDYYGIEKGEYVYNQMINFDIIYTTDSPNEVATNVYFIIGAGENDLRNPLFGLFAAPFALPCMMFARLLFFVPNAYPIAINIVQVLLILASLIMFARMMKLQGGSKYFFLAAASLAYPVLLHVFAMGQYVFSTFWLILFIYAYTADRDYKDNCFILASGSLITGIATFPLVLRGKSIKIWILDLFKLGIKLGMLAVIFGQFAAFTAVGYKAKQYIGFSGYNIKFSDRVLQFLNFISSCFIQPETSIGNFNKRFVSYQLAPVTSVNVLGVIILILAIAGYAFNRKECFAKISIAWLTFSVFVLCLIGWGTQENGLVIYSLYFGWAYFVLIFMLIEKLLANLKAVRYTIYSTAIIALAIINFSGIARMIRFAVEYYPV